MDKKQKEYFPASYILPSKTGGLPNIPMYHPVLYEREKKGLFQCECLALKFGTPEGMSISPNRICPASTKVCQVPMLSTSSTGMRKGGG
jgi:hypothetical protein